MSRTLEGRSSGRTFVVRVSRKLRMVYRLRSGVSRLLGRLLAGFLATLATAFLSTVYALPGGAAVQSGVVTISTPNANAMVVNQGTSKAIIDWNTFSIGNGQSVQFVQPSSSAVALNRVVGGEASSIFGTLSANGQVFLVNPAGVMFAPGAQVNVGGLVASTLGIGNADFLAGNYSFSGTGGTVVNNGAIRAGYVALAAPQVTNNGSIDAPRGSVGLLAGSRVTVDPSGAGLVKFSVDGAAVDAAVTNTGTITADGGQVLVAASAIGDAMATVVNQ
ncbi:MAG TPA: filamentous hemagglutinin N-terminal domain-containing protein, partial [Ramlibacter sp.]